MKKYYSVEYNEVIKLSVIYFLLACIVFLISSCKKDNSNVVSDGGNGIARVFIANEDGESLSVIDAVTMQNIMNIDLSDTMVSMVMPHNAQVAPDGKTVWVTSMGMITSDFDQVIVVDPKTNKVIKRIYLGQDLHLAHIVLDDECNNAFVSAYEGNKVFQINTTTYAVVNTFNLDSASGPHGMRYSDGKLFVANMDGKSMSIIDVATGQVSYIPLGGIAVQSAVTPNGKYVFVSLYDTREVARYNIQTHQVVKISLPSDALGPIQIYPTPDSKYLYVCDQGGLLGQPASNKVFVIDIENVSVTNTITVGNKAHGVVVSNDGKYAFVTNLADNTISIINTGTGKVESTVSTGLSPNGISYWYGIGGMP